MKSRFKKSISLLLSFLLTFSFCNFSFPSHAEAAPTVYTFEGLIGDYLFDESPLIKYYEDLTLKVYDEDGYPMPGIFYDDPSGYLSIYGCGIGSAGSKHTLTIEKTDGSAFTPISVDAKVYTYHTGDGAPYMTDTFRVIGHKSDGSTVEDIHYNVTTESAITVDFTGFTNIVKLEFNMDASDISIANLTLTGGNTAPSFVGDTTSMSVDTDTESNDIKSLLHVSDTDSGQTLTWSQKSAPSHGMLNISSATASSGSSNIIPVGTITYTPTAGYNGSDSFTIQVSDGEETVTRTISISVLSQLTTPNELEWDTTIPGKATWSTVSNASNYSVQLYKDGSASGDAVDVIAESLYYDFTDAIESAGRGVYTFSVTAIGDESSYSNSEESAKSGEYDTREPTFTFAETSVSVDESESSVSIYITLNKACDYNYSVQYTTSNSTAVSGSDYTSCSDTVNFSPGETSKTISIPITQDDVYEGNETFTVTLSNPSSGCTITNGTCTVTITDDESEPSIGFESATSTIDEDAEKATLTVKLSGKSKNDVTVDYATSNDTAEAGSDYTSKSGTLTIPAGSTSGTIEVSLSDDDIYEGDETFNVALSNPSGATLSTNSKTVTIIDSESKPTIGFSTSTTTVSENTDTKATLTVNLSGKSKSDVTVNYATSSGTASAGSDFTSKSGTLTIPAGSTSGTIEIALNDDDVYEGNETFFLILINPVGADLGTTSSNTITITDNEVMPTIEFSSTTTTVDEENDAKATLTVNLTGKAQSDIKVDYATANDTASAGSDYTAKNGTLTILAGSTSGTIEIALSDDDAYEGNEDFTVTLSNQQNAKLGTKTTNTITITDDETKPTVEFALLFTTVSENTDSKATITVKLSGKSQSDVKVDYVTSDGSAEAGSDYTAKTGTLTIPAGSTTGTIEIVLSDDDVYEGDEGLAVTLSNPDGATPGTLISNVITIKDNETEPSIGFESATTTIDEGSDKATLTVKLSGKSKNDVTVDYAMSNDTAEAGSDYTAKIGMLIIPAGSISGAIEIDLSDDDVYEDDETFKVTLSNPKEATLGISSNTVTITDSESKPTVSFSAATAAVDEDADKVTLTVNLSGKSQSDIKVDYATSDDTATAGSDYTAKSGTLTIPAGSTTGTIEIALSDDYVYEGNENFVVTLSDLSGVTLGANTTNTVTITENEVVPTIEFSSSTTTVDEDKDTKAVLTVNLSTKSKSNIKVDYATSNGTAEDGSDYTAKIGTLTIPAGSTSGTIEIALSDDDIYEGNEDFIILLSDPSGVVLGTNASNTITITDNETNPTIEFSTSITTVNEDKDIKAELTVNLSGKSQSDVKVDYATTDGTAEAASDYTAKSGTLTIPAGSTSGTIEIVLSDDDVYEGNEGFAVTLSNPDGATLGTLISNVITIKDNETEPSIGFESATTSIDEDANKVKLSVNLSSKSKNDITVEYTTYNDTAKADGDYIAKSGALTIQAGTTSGTIEIALNDDDIYEGDEDFTITLSSPNGATLGDVISNAITIADNETEPKIGFESATTTVDEDTNKVILTVNLSGKSKNDVTVNYTTVDGTAQAGSDYILKRGRVTIPAGNLKGNIEIELNDDYILEDDEYFIVSLSNANRAVIETQKNKVAIEDNEMLPSENVNDDQLSLLTLSMNKAFVFSKGDTWECITSDFILLSSNSGYDISWTSSNPDVVEIIRGGNVISGIVKRPDGHDASVIITATTAQGLSKSFILIVKSEGASKISVREITQYNASIKIGDNNEDEPIYRTILNNGTKIDYVTITLENVIDILADDSKRETMIVSIDGEEDLADEFNFEISSETVLALAKKGLGITIQSPAGEIILSADDLEEVAQNGTSVYFRILSVENESDAAEKVFLSDDTILSISSSATKQIFGIPRIIQTNMEGYETTVLLPIEGLSEEQLSDKEFLDTLCIYAEHDDGTTEIIKGTLVYENGKLYGIEFKTNKFSRFQTVSIEETTAAIPWILLLGGIGFGILLIMLLIFKNKKGQQIESSSNKI